MSFSLTCFIQLGSYRFQGGVNSIEIERSVKEITDKATLKIPALGRVLSAGNNISPLPINSIATSKLWSEGNTVSISLGYNGDNNLEFLGFVRRVNASVPVTIECEGYAWQLRRQRLTGNWKSIALKDLLTMMVAGTDIKLSPNIEGRTLTNIHFNQDNCLQSLEYLRDHCVLSIYFLFDTLYAGPEEGLPGSTASHALGWNTIRDDKLKWRDAADNPMLVRLITAKGKNQKAPVYTAGTTGGSVVTKNIANTTEPVSAQSSANDMYQKAVYTGFEGSLTAFLQPYIQMCDTDTITDPLYNERNGSYFTVGTKVSFGMDGAKREVFIGRSLSGAPSTNNAS